MVEKKVMSSGIELHFTGLFIMKEVTKLIEDSCKKQGYKKDSVSNYISTNEKEKSHTIKYTFSKKKTEYDSLDLTINCTFSKMKPTFIIKDEIEYSAHKGEINISFHGLRKSRREGVFADRLSGMFASKALNYFGHIILSKFIWRSKYDNVGIEMPDEINDIKDDIYVVLHNRNFTEVKRE